VPLRVDTPEPIVTIERYIARKFEGERFPFAHFWLFSYDPARLPVRILSWIPYRAETDIAIPVYLETPRVWQRGWRAEVNGRAAPVLASPAHLAMVPLDPGSNRVTLRFGVPAWLSVWFWLSLAGWILAAGAGAARLGSGPRRRS
jgi:hypothetical protein